MMATVYLALLGRHGLRELAELNLAKAEYAKSRVRQTPGLSLPFEAPSFNEFTISLAEPAGAALTRARAAGVVAGLDLAAAAPELGPAVLFCATELASRESIDRAIALLAGGAP
jgi:glycine dehydrogenase subunit 1